MKLSVLISRIKGIEMKKYIFLILLVSLFAIAMAYLESAVVVYLRDIYGIVNLQTDLPTEPDRYTWIEIGRELFTLVMLFLIGWFAAKRCAARVGYMIIAFGIWDIFYYIWLYIFIGWPTSLLEWDILFLIPLPWWGPVISPVMIAALMVISGILAVRNSIRNKKIRFSTFNISLLVLSILLALYVFMKNAITNIPGGVEAVAKTKPNNFSWILFLGAYLGMVFAVFRIFKKDKG